MTLLEKTGSGSVDPEDFNALVAAVQALQAGNGGSQTVVTNPSDPAQNVIESESPADTAALTLHGATGQAADVLTLRQADDSPYLVEGFNETYDPDASAFSFYIGSDGSLNLSIDAGVNWAIGSRISFVAADLKLIFQQIAAFSLLVSSNHIFEAKGDSDNDGSHAWIGPVERDKTMLAIRPHPATNKALELIADTAQAADLLTVVASDGSTVFDRINKDGYFIIKKNSAPADGDLNANEAAIWFDSTDGAAKLMVKAKQADGTVKTGSINVQT